MNLRLIFLLCTWLSFMGCGHLIQNPFLPQEEGAQTTEPSTTADIQPTQDTDFNNPDTAQADSLNINDSVPEEIELESVEPDATIAIENNGNPAEKLLPKPLKLYWMRPLICARCPRIFGKTENSKTRWKL
jgi:hypothetical protein